MACSRLAPPGPARRPSRSGQPAARRACQRSWRRRRSPAGPPRAGRIASAPDHRRAAGCRPTGRPRRRWPARRAPRRRSSRHAGPSLSRTRRRAGIASPPRPPSGGGRSARSTRSGRPGQGRRAGPRARSGWCRRRRRAPRNRWPAAVVRVRRGLAVTLGLPGRSRSGSAGCRSSGRCVPHPTAGNPAARQGHGRESLVAERRMLILPRRVWPTAGASVAGGRIVMRARTAWSPGLVIGRMPGWADSASDTIVTVRRRAWGQIWRFRRRVPMLHPAPGRVAHGERAFPGRKIEAIPPVRTRTG